MNASFQEDSDLSQKMVQAWVDFASTGIFFFWLYEAQPKIFLLTHSKVCIRIMLYQQILSRATPKCVEQLKCGEQKFIEDILNDRWQHHIQRQVLGTFAVYNF